MESATDLRPEMVGREQERAHLAAALDDALYGRGRAAIVLGEAGMGKSMLADWLVAQATSSGLRVVRGSCSAAGMPPLWPWRRALDTIGSTVPWQEARSVLTGSDRELLAAAVVDAIAAAARQQPLLVVLEDVHWSDFASVLVARAVADAVAALPVMLLLTCRDDLAEATPQIRDQLADLPIGVRRVPLPTLDVLSVASLAASILGRAVSEQQAQDLHGRTGGNPFFVIEVVRLSAAHGPAGGMVVPLGVREALQRRLARLSQPSAAFLTVAAIAAATTADVIEDELVCAVCGTDEADAARLLDEAVVARLIDADPAGVARYRFRHALVREVLEQGVPGTVRGGLHERLAQALERRTEPQPVAARLAHHWSRAGGARARERAAFWSLRAARDAMAGFGFEAAATHYTRALTDASTDRIAVSIELGEALQLSGDAGSARDVLLAAAEEASADGRSADLAQAALALGGGLAGFEVPIMDERQAELLERADADLPPDELALRAAVRGRLSLALAGSVPLRARVSMAEEAVGIARRAGDRRIESAVLAAYCDAIAGPDHVSERISAATRMLSLASATPTSNLRDQTTVLLARRLLLVAHLEEGDLAAADEQALAYERLAHRLGIPLYAWLPEIWRGMRALLDGDPEDACATQPPRSKSGAGRTA